MAETTANAKFITGPDRITISNVPGVSTVSAANVFTQTYSTTQKTVSDPTAGVVGLDYPTDASVLLGHMQELAQNINAIIDVLQAHGLAG